MDYREWKAWVKSLPWSLRWFVYLVLSRPIIDNFYYLKKISPLLSPLNIVGILTPILVLFAVMQLKKPVKSKLDTLFMFWGILAVSSCCFMITGNVDTIMLSKFFLKLTMPFYLYFFARLLVRSKQDLHGVLKTFLYSCLFAIALFLYEITMGPIRVEESRGLERIQGNFADVMNYAIYLSFGFLIFCYFSIPKEGVLKSLKGAKNTFIVGGLCALVLGRIHHTASYAVFAILLLLYMVYVLRVNRKLAALAFIIIAGASFSFGERILEEKINPLVETDLAVYRGEKSTDRLFHGRMYRWRNIWEVFSKLDILSWLFGAPIGLKNPAGYVSGGAHNDFLRILMFTGFLGLITYLLILMTVVKKLISLDSPLQFLGFGSLAILFLYSLTTCPTLYVVMLYVLCSVFAYLALPFRRRRYP